MSFKVEPASPPAGGGSQAVRAADWIPKGRVEIVDDEHAPVNYYKFPHELGFQLFDVFRHLSWADLGAVHVALRIHRYALRSTCSLHFERVRNTVQDLTVFEA